MGVILVYVRLSLSVIECSYVFVYTVAVTYIYTYVCVCNGVHLFIYTHISTVCRWEGMRRKKSESVRTEERVRENRSLLSEFLFLSKFIVAETLFFFEYEKSVLWGNLLNNDDD